MLYGFSHRDLEALTDDGPSDFSENGFSGKIYQKIDRRWGSSSQNERHRAGSGSRHLEWTSRGSPENDFQGFTCGRLAAVCLKEERDGTMDLATHSDRNTHYVSQWAAGTRARASHFELPFKVTREYLGNLCEQQQEERTRCCVHLMAQNPPQLPGGTWPGYAMVKDSPAVYKKFDPDILNPDVPGALEPVYNGRLVKKFWFRKKKYDNRAVHHEGRVDVRYKKPTRDELTALRNDEEFAYARLVTNNSHIEDVISSIMKVVVLLMIQVFNVQFLIGTIHEDFKSRPIWVCAMGIMYLLAVSVWLAGAALQARKKYKAGPEDYVRSTSCSDCCRLIMTIFFLELFNLPKFMCETPSVFHIRKNNQTFAVFTLNEQRMWIRGFLSDSQYHYKTFKGLLDQAPSVMFKDIPMPAVQLYMLVIEQKHHGMLVWSFAWGIIGLLLDLHGIFLTKCQQAEYKEDLHRRLATIETCLDVAHSNYLESSTKKDLIDEAKSIKKELGLSGQLSPDSNRSAPKKASLLHVPLLKR